MEVEMDELVLDVDVEEATEVDELVKSELEDDVNTVKPSTDSVTVMEVTGNSGEAEGESSPSEPKWLQQDEPIALWVKWRGKWQAGIRCAKADWPLSTLRGKPTHDRKKYCVIFFPHTKNHSWADMQLVRSINEFPDPIAYKSHKVGLKLVKDLTAARRFIMRKLTVGMFNIVDQFPLEVVAEGARDIIIWKEFAMGATRSTSYHDLGIMLVKLHSMILQQYMDPVWLENSFTLWVQKCNNAVNAESIELLNEEFDSCIKWNEVKSLSETPVLPMVLSEWKTWKHDIAKWFSISRRSVGEIGQQNGESVFNSDVQASRKRPKLEIRRAEATNASQMVTEASPQELTAIDSEPFGSRGNANTPEVVKEENQIRNAPTNGLDLWDGIVVEANGSQLMKTKEVNGLSHPQHLHINEPVLKKPFGSGNKSQQCTAFIESKGRQCVRWANEGDVYCCVHLASRFTTKSTKNEGSPAVEAPMCGGITVLGTKCKHRSLPGLLFCKKHRPQTGIEKPDNSLSLPAKRKVAEIMSDLETNQCQDLVPFGEHEGPSFEKHEPHGATSFTEMFEHCSQEDNLCIGSCSENSYIPCSEFSTKHSLYCEQHLPNWLKRARNGKSRIISKEVFIDLLRGCLSREEKLALHQACDIFYKLFKSVLSLRNSVPMEVQLDWAKAEASRNADAGIGEFLMKLVSYERERLTRIWGFGAGAGDDEEDASLLYDTYAYGDDDNGEETTDKDKWSFSGFACAICLDSFVNRKLLESHVEERHHVQFAEKCMLLQCIPCGSHFGDKDQLLLHVQAVHPSECKSLTVVSECNLTNGESSQQPEAGSSQIVLSQNSESTSGVHKFVCKFCGMKFNLLPDLGRHHQAEHMGPNLVGSRGPKKGLRFNTYRMKSGRLSRPNKFKKSLGAVSYRIRNRAGVNMKRRIQGSKSLGTEGNTGVSSPLPSDSRNVDGTTDAHCSVVSNILLSKVQKAKHRPNNLDILSAARSACCRVSLELSLEAKFGNLPERIYLKAAKLCGEQGVQVQWHQEGYICSNGCKSVKDSNLLRPLIPRQENDRFGVAMEAGEHSNTELEVDECHCIMEAHHFSKRPFGNTTVLCNDLSCGKEAVPICVVDDGLLNSEKLHEKPWESFNYVTKSILHPSMDLVKENLQLRCGCRSSVCSPVTCDHVYLFNNDFEDARDIYGKPMRFRFPYDDKQRIILEEGYPVYECNDFCGCSRTCQNRVLQNGVHVKLEVFRTESKGWGLRACEHILRGTFVCEFIGEVIDQEEANKRRNQYGKEGCSYIQEIDANMNDIGRLIEGESDYVIDATTHGNISRYINHSCSPNLVNHQVIVDSMESPLAHIGLYASMDIAAGEEITRDYGRRLVTSGKETEHPCHCKATNCRGSLLC
ncbi:PREDICTED: histone-lysine N-methyltransferase SUVR5-like [Camelina sativa]|uniref:Histone-lysine N-methyltransferase SUVR5-like n=1 Tax=Camelina sativa TaxID=90675 RepID=A0ABM0TPH2_CAMSA|nr:PREDICTED: histone-lysine N-methyltransferase SUVR5-like [Camelina sativa]XP_010429321.1 PREDICTED: histone-lysine N-methyltransferase SUVR5-like [Camelina sativa]XP_010429323.1 PREDICTED: histone-lysine N-methyltransferase SUVR5-like [Camelina sativa]XP_010429324.1 PREDICTED: histone-lysine N-methyltransferase SUVR5-like [Camelina sativa]XP_010429325.1 PREDICTED: histone-lysine N-methyltransferase SUVR5-like [Camelina sativa]